MNNTVAPKPVLGYWKIRCFGQHIRFLLRYLEIDFEDKYYEFTLPNLGREQWLAERDGLKLPLPNLPYLLDGPHKVTESRAIMKHLCRTRKPELLGNTPEIQTKVDMVDYFLYDLQRTAFMPVVYHYTEESHRQYKELEPIKLGYLSDFLGDNEWITGSSLTYVDFYMYEVLYHLTVYDPKTLTSFPKLEAYLKRFEELPAIKAYMGSPAYLSKPMYAPQATIKI